MHSISELRDSFLSYLEQNTQPKEPHNLYNPANYILGLGGKRVRPILTLLATELFDCEYEKALPAAMAVEIFHNFTLVHDDIMDEAPLRRGKETVHHKWDINTGILSGDVMMIMAYQCFDIYEPKVYKRLAKLLSRTAIEVCEGQQLDVDFETRSDVSIEEYLHMITCKTAVLVGAAFKMGATVARAEKPDRKLIYKFGLNLGIAFQLQDDYLDIFGDEAAFGKQIAGDIIENKKTYLYLKALELANADDKRILEDLFSTKLEDNTDKINTVVSIYKKYGSDVATQQAIQEYTNSAFEYLDELDLSKDRKQILKDFGTNLMNRQF